MQLLTNTEPNKNNPPKPNSNKMSKAREGWTHTLRKITFQ